MVVEIQLGGTVKEAADVAKEILQPWRRKYAKKLALLDEQSRQIALKKAEAEALEAHIRVLQVRREVQVTEAEAEKNRAEAEKTRAEAEKTRAETEKLRDEASVIRAAARKAEIEVEKLELELKEQYFDLALRILKKWAPGMPEAQRLRYLPRIIPVIERAIKSPLSITDHRTGQ